MLSKSQYSVLESLVEVKRHNSNRKNIRVKFQSSRYNNEDIQFLADNKFAKTNLLGEFEITKLGEDELRNRF